MREKFDNMQHEMRESAHKIWLAGLGAMSVAGEEGQKLFKSLVEKGQEFEGREGAPVDSVKKGAEQAKGRMDDIWNRFEESFKDKIAMVLHKMDVPTRDEINQLTEKIEKVIAAIEKKEGTKTEKK